MTTLISERDIIVEDNIPCDDALLLSIMETHALDDLASAETGINLDSPENQDIFFDFSIRMASTSEVDLMYQVSDDLTNYGSIELDRETEKLLARIVLGHYGSEAFKEEMVRIGGGIEDINAVFRAISSQEKKSVLDNLQTKKEGVSQPTAPTRSKDKNKGL